MKREQHLRIERYVNGRMTDAERSEFEQSLAKSDELRTMVEAERGILSALNADKRAVPSAAVEPAEHLIAKLRSTPAQSSTTPALGLRNRILLSNQSWIPVLAGVAVGGAVVGIFIMSMLNPTTEYVQPVLQRDTVYVPVAPHAAVDASAAPSNRNTQRVQRTPATQPEESAKEVQTQTSVSAPTDISHRQPDGDRETMRELLKQSERTAPVGIKRSDSVEIRVKLEK
jgi:anti-sigma factor RsiW